MRARRTQIFWACFAATLLVYGVMVSWSLPKISAAAGGAVPFDLRPMGYSLEEARTFLAALSAEGRDFYRGTQQVVDSVYPPLLGLTLGLGLWIMSSSLWLRVPLALCAALGTLFDLAENRLVGEMLGATAETLDAGLVRIASLVTVLKSIFTTLAMTALLVLALRWSWRRRRTASP